jgi:hypothetical protein
VEKKNTCRIDQSKLTSDIATLAGNIADNKLEINGHNATLKDADTTLETAKTDLQTAQENKKKNQDTYDEDTATNHKDHANYTLSLATVTKAISALKEHENNDSLGQVITAFEGVQGTVQTNVSSLETQQETRTTDHNASVKLSNQNIGDAEKLILDTENLINKTEGHKADEITEKKNNIKGKKQAQGTLDDITPNCTFIQDNFGARKAARNTESTQLQELKKVLDTLV